MESIVLRINQKLIITPGVPIQVSRYPVLATRVSVQTIGQGIVYLMDGIPYGVTPLPKGAGANQLTAAFAPTTVPGSIYKDHDEDGIDLSQMWFDGDTAGDAILISARMKPLK